MEENTSLQEALLAQLLAMGVRAENASRVVYRGGATTVDEAFALLTGEQQQQASSSGVATSSAPEDWDELFAAEHGGRPYFAHKRTGETTWEEPRGLREHNARVDAATFDVPPPRARDVWDRLRALQSVSAWAPARDLLARVLGAICGAPGDARVRGLRKSSAAFAAALWGVSEGRALLSTLGFVDEGEIVRLPPEAPLGGPRMALAYLQRAQSLTESSAAASGASGAAPSTPEEAAAYRRVRCDRGGPPGGSRGARATPAAGRRWQREVHHCGRCSALIVDGSEKVWTGRWDAPAGQFRYACEQCEGYSLCERCWEERQRGAAWHDASHAFEVHAPVTTRYDARTRTGGGPWGNFGASVSARSRDRLRERTGL